MNATPQFCYEKLCVAVTTRVSRTCLVSVAFPTSCDFVRLFRYTCWQSKCTFLGWLFLYSIAYTHPPHPPPHIIIVKLQFHWSSQRGHCHSQLSSFLLFWIQPVLCTFSGLSQEWQTLHVLYTKSGSDKLYMFSGPNQEWQTLHAFWTESGSGKPCWSSTYLCQERAQPPASNMFPAHKIWGADIA